MAVMIMAADDYGGGGDYDNSGDDGSYDNGGDDTGR